MYIYTYLSIQRDYYGQKAIYNREKENLNKYINSKRNFIVNEVNWNILVTSGKEIKRDSTISGNESRKA